MSTEDVGSAKDSKDGSTSDINAKEPPGSHDDRKQTADIQPAESETAKDKGEEMAEPAIYIPLMLLPFLLFSWFFFTFPVSFSWL